MAASDDSSVKHVIKKATLRCADGFGVSYVMSKKVERRLLEFEGASFGNI